MRTVTLVGLCLGLTVGLRPAVAWAQTGPPLSLTLDEAIARGLAAAPRVAAAKAREQAAGATVSAQAAGRLPVVSTGAGFLRTNHVEAFGLMLPDGTFRTIFPDLPDNYQVHAEVDVPIYTAGRVGALVSSAKADAAAVADDRASTEADLRLEIATGYWSLVTARASVTVLEQALRRADASVSDARARVEAGFLPPSDRLSAEAERAREAVRLIQARHEAAVAELTFDRLVGADLGQPIVTASSIADADPAAEALEHRGVVDLVDHARQGRPEVMSLKAHADSLEAAAQASRAVLRPAVAGIGTVEPARPNPIFVPRADDWKTSWSLGVNVNWAVWDGGRAQAQAAAETAQAEALRRQADDVEAGIAVEIRARLLDLDADRAALAASGEAVAAASEAHRVVAERFRAGVATSTEVLDAEVGLLEASLDQTRLAAAERLDEARLRHAIGDRP
jgi:outer membrane protein TolC